MKNYFNLFLSLSLMVLIGCNKPPNPCNTNNSDFNQLYVTLKNSAPNFIDDFIMDTKVHAYSFTVSSQKEICSIGYKSYTGMDQTPYTIVIIDSLNNSTLYSSNHLFSSSQTTYITLNQTVILVPGKTYTINRIQSNNVSASKLTGRLLYKNSFSITFPHTQGNLSIINSSFYDNIAISHMSNSGIPYIDIVFKTI